MVITIYNNLNFWKLLNLLCENIDFPEKNLVLRTGNRTDFGFKSSNQNYFFISKCKPYFNVFTELQNVFN